MGSRADSLPEKCWRKIGIYGDSSCERLASCVHCQNCEEYSRAAKTLFDREVATDELNQWTRQLAEQKLPEKIDRVSLLIFRVRGEWLALTTESFREAVDLRPVHSVPFRSNRVFQGLVNINGELIPCLALVELLDLSGDVEETSQSQKSRPRMVVVEKDKEPFVFPVNEVLGVRLVSLADVARTPSTVSKSPSALNRGVFELEGKTVGWLDTDRFFAALAGSLRT